MAAPEACPVCGMATAGVGELASHMVDRADASEGAHVMWLNRNASRTRVSPSELERLLPPYVGGGGETGDRLRR